MALLARYRRNASPDATLAMRLSVSSNGRYLENQSGNPVHLRGFSAWPLFLSNPARLDDYLDYVQSRIGSSSTSKIALKTQAICKWGDNAPNTFDDIAPFTGADFSTPNPTYWARIDEIVANVRARGMYLFFGGAYYGYGPAVGTPGAQGWYEEIDDAGSTVIREYFEFLGARYANEPHIIWAFYGDNTPPHTGTTETPEYTEAMLDGLDDGGATQLRIAHLAGEDTSAEVIPTGHPWPIFSFYTWEDPQSIEEYALDAWAADVGPIAQVEVKYEHNISPPLALRRQWWRALLGGSLAYNDYGNEGFGYPDADNAPFWPGGDWEDYVDDPGLTWYKILADVVTAESWHLLEPELAGETDLVTTGANGNWNTVGNDNYVSRCLASDGSCAFFYTETGASFTVDLSEFSGAVEAHWIDPTAAISPISAGTFSNSGTQAFSRATANNAGANDWCLRIRRT